jgi:hypothetical protein
MITIIDLMSVTAIATAVCLLGGVYTFLVSLLPPKGSVLTELLRKIAIVCMGSVVAGMATLLALGLIGVALS